MWRDNAATLVVMILLSLALMSINKAAWIILGILALIGAIYLAFRRGTGLGHEACSVKATVDRAADPASKMHGQLDDKYMAQAYSPRRAMKGALLCALVPFVCSCAYIISMLVGAEPLILPTRLAAWVLALPFWPLVAHWFETYDTLAPALVAVFLISPFVLPMATYAGYLQGPKLWAKTEKAMAEGKRRAKAKSRVVKKSVPRQQKPEI